MLNGSLFQLANLAPSKFDGMSRLGCFVFAEVNGAQFVSWSGRPSGYPPGPPQIRTCAIYASGSSVVKIRGAV